MRDEGFMFPREERIRLTKQGYKELCRMIDGRDGYRCIICGAPSGLHHHHVRFRSAWGSDREDNMVLLCAACHDIYAHGTKEKGYRAMFQDYLESEHVKAWREAHRADLERIYKMRR